MVRKSRQKWNGLVTDKEMQIYEFIRINEIHTIYVYLLSSSLGAGQREITWYTYSQNRAPIIIPSLN